MKRKKTAIVIGSGAGGAMAARELQGEFDVTILEWGGEFKPYKGDISKLAFLQKSGLLFDERMMRITMPSMQVTKNDGMVVVRGKGIGGTTTLSAANGIRYDEPLKELGIDLDPEFEDIFNEVSVTTKHQLGWSVVTKKMYSVFEDMGLDPIVTPKMIDLRKCRRCGQCILGCGYGAKWDSRVLINESISKGAKLISKCKVKKLDISDGRVKAVHTVTGGRMKTYTADLIILSAGGIGTPIILENSGIKCKKTLFADPVLCVAAPFENAGQYNQIGMPFISQQEKYMISPYFDYLSFFFNKSWHMPQNNILSLMIKYMDEESGYVTPHSVHKGVTESDRKVIDESVELCKDVLERMGVKRNEIFLGTLNAGHPGGMFPLTKNEAETFHNPMLPENLYVSDSSLFPRSMGNPPILTIMAMSKRIAKLCISRINEL